MNHCSPTELKQVADLRTTPERTPNVVDAASSIICYAYTYGLQYIAAHTGVDKIDQK